MSAADQKRKRITRRYVESLSGKVERLSSMARALEDGRESAPPRVRHFAHQLAGSGGSYGFPAITAAALGVANAEDAELPNQLSSLIDVLSRTAREATISARKLLVVDDDDDICRLIEESVGGMCHTMTAGTATEGEMLLSKHRFDLMVLDLTLPDRDGRELLRELRSSAHTASLPVVVLTAHGGTQPRKECIRLGVDHFVAKPADIGLIHAAIESTIRRSDEFARQTRRDALTGLHNRLGFQQEVRALASLASRTQTPLTIGIIDLDRFKDVNDTFGHSVGDLVLRGMGDELAQVLRASDVSARWGGEEFAVALPNTSSEEAVIAVSKVQAGLSSRTFGSEPRVARRITFSAGLVEMRDGEPFEDALSEADRLLYAAKAAGRNRVFNALPKQAGRVRVLLAEDDPDAARLARDVLEEPGDRIVEVVLTGKEAIERASAERFDLVVLDWRLPDMNGDVVLETIRALHSYRRIPIVMLTVVGDDVSIERAFDLGADEYVQKPFRPRELGARIRRLLRRSLPPASLPPRRVDG